MINLYGYDLFWETPVLQVAFQQEGDEIGETVEMTIESDIFLTQFYAVANVRRLPIMSC